MTSTAQHMTARQGPRLMGKKQATRARIIDRAVPLFSQHSYESITMESIASAAGISRATIYLHFKTKAELVAAMLERLSPDVVESYRQLDGCAPDDVTGIRQWVNHTSRMWVDERPRLETLEHALAIEPIVARQWYETLSASAEAMTHHLARFPDGEEREKAKVAVISTMLGFERTLYFTFVRDAPVDPTNVLEALAMQWYFVLTSGEDDPVDPVAVDEGG